MFFMLLWTERNSGSYNGEVSLKNPPPVVSARGSEREFSPAFYTFWCATVQPYPSALKESVWKTLSKNGTSLRFLRVEVVIKNSKT